MPTGISATKLILYRNIEVCYNTREGRVIIQHDTEQIVLLPPSLIKTWAWALGLDSVGSAEMAAHCSWLPLEEEQLGLENAKNQFLRWACLHGECVSSVLLLSARVCHAMRCRNFSNLFWMYHFNIFTIEQWGIIIGTPTLTLTETLPWMSSTEIFRECTVGVQYVGMHSEFWVDSFTTHTSN